MRRHDAEETKRLAPLIDELMRLVGGNVDDVVPANLARLRADDRLADPFAHDDEVFVAVLFQARRRAGRNLEVAHLERRPGFAGTLFTRSDEPVSNDPRCHAGDISLTLYAVPTPGGFTYKPALLLHGLQNPAPSGWVPSNRTPGVTPNTC